MIINPNMALAISTMIENSKVCKGTPFYAEDLNFSGAVMTSLLNTYKLVKPTGKYKTVRIPIGESYEDIKVKQWVFCPTQDKVNFLFEEVTKELEALTILKKSFEKIA